MALYGTLDFPTFPPTEAVFSCQRNSHLAGKDSKDVLWDLAKMFKKFLNLCVTYAQHMRTKISQNKALNI